MKTLSRYLLPISFLALAGCGGMHAATSGGTAASLLSTPTTGDSASTTLSVVAADYNSNTVALNASTSLLDQLFFSSHPVNPTNLRVQVDLADVGNGSFGGNVIVAYEDGGVTHHLKVSTQHPWTTVSDSSLNIWHDWQGTGTKQFHGIFEDSAGAIVLVIDSVTSLGDGSSAAVLGGSVWFQNFGETFPPQGPEKMCWQIQIGPYDCRTFLSGSSDYNSATVNTYSSLFPTTSTTGGDSTNGFNGNRPAYIKLGTFNGLSKTAAFNQQ